MPPRTDSAGVTSPHARLTLAAVLLVLLASTLLLATYYRHVPLLQDGGWYSYPGYALAEGGDPSENVPGYAIDPLPDRVVAKFLWENRSNLTVPIFAAWFHLADASWQSLRVLGAMQLLLLATFAALLVLHATSSRLLAVAAFAVSFSDSVVIAATMSNARPDVTIAVWAMAALLAATRLQETGSRLATTGTLLLAVTLPLLHVTSAIAIAALSVYCALLALRPIHGNNTTASTRAVLALVSVIPVLIYLVRQPLLDAMIPTAVPASIEAVGQHSLVQKLLSNFSGGPGAKAAMEWPRWRNYFVVANIPHLLLIVAGVAASVVWRRRPETSGLGGRLFIAVAVASLVQLITDPHGTSSHLIILAQMAYVASLMILAPAVNAEAPPATHRIIHGLRLPLLLLFVAVMKLGHIYSVHRNFARESIDNYTIEVAMQEWVRARAGGPARAIGPAELWPYVSPLRAPIVIMDLDRSKVPSTLDEPEFGGVDTLIINEDYWEFGWGERVRKWQREGTISPTLSIGECGRTVVCLAFYKITHPQPL